MLRVLKNALKEFFRRLPGARRRAATIVVSFAVSTTLFAAMFKYLPDVDLAWRDVWVAAAA